MENLSGYFIYQCDHHNFGSDVNPMCSDFLHFIIINPIQLRDIKYCGALMGSSIEHLNGGKHKLIESLIYYIKSNLYAPYQNSK